MSENFVYDQLNTSGRQTAVNHPGGVKSKHLELYQEFRRFANHVLTKTILEICLTIQVFVTVSQWWVKAKKFAGYCLLICLNSRIRLMDILTTWGVTGISNTNCWIYLTSKVSNLITIASVWSKKRTRSAAGFVVRNQSRTIYISIAFPTPVQTYINVMGSVHTQQS